MCLLAVTCYGDRKPLLSQHYPTTLILSNPVAAFFVLNFTVSDRRSAAR